VQKLLWGLQGSGGFCTVFFTSKVADQARKLFAAASMFSAAIMLVGCIGLGSSSIPKSITEAGVVVSPGGFDFKNVAVGQTLTQTMKITNSSKSPVQISTLGVSNNQFAISGPSVPRSILPGMNLSYTLAFTPTSAGSASGSVTIRDDVSTMPLMIKLSGTSLKSAAALQVIPAAIGFGNLALQSTGTQNVTLQNTGDVSVSINGISLAGAGFGYADISPGYSLSPNQKVTFQVWFKPQVKGAAAGTLSILAANLANPVVASLSGDGVASGTNPTPPASPTPTSHTVHLAWNASSSSVVGYRLYRSDVAGGPYASVNGSSIDALSYDDTGVTSGTTYYYVVTAVNSSGEESVYSNQAAAVIPTP